MTTMLLTRPSEAADWLRSHDNFLILTHRRPDGDTVGCAAALCRGLRNAGKTAAVLENPQLTDRYAPYLEGLTVPQVPENAVIVAVDIATENLLPLNGTDLAGRIALCIDHHESNEQYAVNTILWAHSAACGELMLEILRQLGPVDKAMGEALYVAISTDCGCFQYSNTSAQTMRAAADLKDLGVETYPINKKLFATKSLARLKLEGLLADSLELLADGKVGICTLTCADMLAIGATEDDADDIAGFARSVQGVEISVMLRELPTGAAKLSLRSGGLYNVSEICKRLGGGGHKAAAGAEVAEGMDAARAAILDAIRAEGLAV
jgi:phosphoesterase RecJ-like protein